MTTVSSMDKTWCQEVIITTTLRRGKGVENDPIRIITQVFTKKGVLIAEHDPVETHKTERELENAFNAARLLTTVVYRGSQTKEEQVYPTFETYFKSIKQ